MLPNKIVIGGGISGLLLSYVFQKLKVPFSIFDRDGGQHVLQRSGADRRLISLSAQNALFLKDVLDLSTAYPVYSIDFSVNNTHVYTHTSSEPIAYMFFYQQLYARLYAHVTRLCSVIGYAPLLERRNNAWVVAGYDEKLTPPTIFACDGKRSSVRKMLGVRVKDSAIRQCAFVGRVRGDNDSKGKAFECFLPQGVLTLLPEEKGVFSFIWHVRAPMEETLRSLSPKDFVDFMQKYVPCVKLSEMLCPYDTYQVAPACAEQFYAQNVHLCGDAAHSLHPLSGQSLNVYIESLRGLYNHYHQNVNYSIWSRVYAKQARVMFHATTFLDLFFCSNRFLPFKEKIFGLGSLVGMTQFCADYILGGKNALDRTKNFEILSGENVFAKC